MASTLRQLLVQQGARLQSGPALSTPEWGTLTYLQLRNRVEGVALGLAAHPELPRRLHLATGSPWDWISEVAVAACGRIWDRLGDPVPSEVLGKGRFNDEAGRQAYHDLEERIDGQTPFLRTLTQGELLVRLRRLNVKLGWDHRTVVRLPLEALPTSEGRALLWSALYAGAHAHLEGPPEPTRGLRALFGRTPKAQAWDPAPFKGLLD